MSAYTSSKDLLNKEMIFKSFIPVSTRYQCEFSARVEHLNVRYWHLADIGLCGAHVCFWG